MGPIVQQHSPRLGIVLMQKAPFVIPVEKWKTMLDFNETTNQFEDLSKIIKTYTLTATWFVEGEIKKAVDSVQKTLATRIQFDPRLRICLPAPPNP